MKKHQIYFLLWISIVFLSCGRNGYRKSIDNDESAVNILFLHHSTGNSIYKGEMKNGEPDVLSRFKVYNQENGVNYNLVEQAFPKSKILRYIPGYGWNNYPFDYYNIWVKNGDKETYKYEPTLKTLAPLWDVIIIKHCFPVSSVLDDGNPNIDSDLKTIANYKLQYEALKKEFHKYPNTKFIVWTGAVHTQKNNSEERAQRTCDFFTWVKQEWDEQEDNIYIWDFYELETEGGLYLKDDYAVSPGNSHPNKEFSARVAPLFCNRVVDVIETNGALTDLKGICITNDSIVSAIK